MRTRPASRCFVTGGIVPIPGTTMLEKRRYAREHLDGLRRSIVFEPRGHADMYGAIPRPSRSRRMVTSAS